LFPDLFERVPDRGLGRTGDVKLRDQTINARDVRIDRLTIVAAKRNREGGVPDLGRHTPKLCRAFAVLG
jgi:hypothetical protein